MRDNDLLTMRYKPICTTPNWSPPEGILIWKTNENNKAMLPDGEPKPNKVNPMITRKILLRGFLGLSKIGKSCVKKTIPQLCMDHIDG